MIIYDMPALPKFLDRKKNKLTSPAPIANLVTRVSDIPDERFECVAPGTAELIRKELRSGRFQMHWLDDPSTLLVFEREHQIKKQRAEARAENAAVERKINRVVKPEWGHDQKIIVLIRNPKRQASAARIPRFASLLEYLDKNPNASVVEIFANTLYIKSDFTRDVRLKIIKTDIITQAVAPKRIVDLREIKKAAPKAIAEKAAPSIPEITKKPAKAPAKKLNFKKATKKGKKK